ncbi:fumarylacetoacetate hydrolase family protein [Pluralibacter gergoviae]|uniref:fumarylacetoacetate hydrolase family protein n=1 Tax=Pluralibacter gergoviae TaxID=61647 RepID=UPI000BFB77A8|nr:fumarylacetoacetate hydrolase family protein [Pluralibacter gergoviae]PHH46574.1 2-oxopent-4-enoate hydratase [Pluralibacter gergoviae]
MEEKLVRYGNLLYEAWKNRRPIGPLIADDPTLTIEDAYRIQQQMIARRLEATGEQIVGKKIGVTSNVVMKMLDVHQPDFGMLTSGMVCNHGAAIDTRTLIAPKVEGEIAFILKRDLIGPGVTIADVLAATELVVPCIEVVDSRIRDWKITIQDTVADNASSGLIVVGDSALSPHGLDLALVGMTLEKNGEVVDTGAGAAALGHPANAVAWLANTLGALDIPLNAGEIILSGSLAAMVPVSAGDSLAISLGGLGTVSARFI